MFSRGLRPTLQTTRIAIRTASRTRTQRQAAPAAVKRTDDDVEIDAKRVAISNFWNKHLPKKPESRVTAEVDQNDEYEAWMLKRKGQTTFETTVAQAIAQVEEEEPEAAEYERWRKDRYHQTVQEVPARSESSARESLNPANPSAETDPATPEEKAEEPDPVAEPAATEPAVVRTGVLASDPYIIDAPARGPASVFPHLKVDTIPSGSSQLSGTIR